MKSNYQADCVGVFSGMDPQNMKNYDTKNVNTITESHIYFMHTLSFTSWFIRNVLTLFKTQAYIRCK